MIPLVSVALVKPELHTSNFVETPDNCRERDLYLIVLRQFACVSLTPKLYICYLVDSMLKSSNDRETEKKIKLWNPGLLAWGLGAELTTLFYIKSLLLQKHLSAIQ